MNRVVIAAFREQPEAIGAQRALASQGISSEVRERAEDLPRLCADAFASGFDVVVGERDADQAIAYLQYLWPDAPEPAPVAERCPECGSTDVFRLRRVWIFAAAAAICVIGGAITMQEELFLVLLAAVVLVLAVTPPWRCRSCRHAWRA